MATIELNHVTKIEGHAGVMIDIEQGSLKNLELRIVEGARFFESILKGKKYDELPLIASRICGVCSPNHAITSIIAIEDAFGIKPAKQVKLLRELLAIGGLIQSHALHLYLMVLPDYLGPDSALQMRMKNNDIFERSLCLKRLGHQIVTTVGGRDIHPVTALAGGFSVYPTKDQLEELMLALKKHEEDALKTVELFSSLAFGKFEHDSSFMSLHSDDLQGNKICLLDNSGIKDLHHDFEDFIQKYFQYDSTAEYVVAKNKAYTVGAQARAFVNNDLPGVDNSFELPGNISPLSPFSNIVYQAIEIMGSIQKSQNIIEELLKTDCDHSLNLVVQPKPSTGIGVMEAPRGLLFHKYSFDDKGYCTYANVTTPTSQNLRTIEDCLRKFISAHTHLEKEVLIKETEKLIRSFDPCISCSCH